jgi:Uma2 family endonuclease
MPVSEATYKRVALEDDDNTWELVCGQLRRKPAMTLEHNDIGFELAYAIRRQISRESYHVRADAGRTRVSTGSYYVPDVFVVPTELVRARLGQPMTLEVYSEPLPFVAEIWSRSTGDYDVDAKLPEYRARGDREIWRVHPYDRAVRVWRRQSSGEYAESVYTGGRVAIESLPGVTIDLDELFTI